MFGWFRKKPPAPAPAPEPESSGIVVRAAGMAGGKQSPGLTAQQVMSIAIEESIKAGRADDVQVKEAIDHARQMFKQAKISANATKKSVIISVGERRLMVEP